MVAEEEGGGGDQWKVSGYGLEISEEEQEDEQYNGAFMAGGVGPFVKGKERERERANFE